MNHSEASYTTDPTGAGAMPFHHIGVYYERKWLAERRARAAAIKPRNR
jgi:hypothetical protein